MKMKCGNNVVYNIYDGVYQRGKLFKIPFTEKRELLKELDIVIVIGLAPARVDLDLKKLHDSYDISYVYMPIADGVLSKTTSNKLLKLAGHVAQYMDEENGCVLSYCNAGRNRSALMNALIIRQLANCSGADALEILRKERPNSLANEHFVSFLKGLP